MRDEKDREIEFAAYIGIDWADQKHACALQRSTESGVVQGELIHKPEAVEVWAADLYRQFGGRPIAIALEQSRGSLLFMLLKYEHLVLFPVHPSTLVNYRKGFRPSGAKNDPSECDSVGRSVSTPSRKTASAPSGFRAATYCGFRKFTREGKSPAPERRLPNQATSECKCASNSSLRDERHP